MTWSSFNCNGQTFVFFAYKNELYGQSINVKESGIIVQQQIINRIAPFLIAEK